jgi:hypothetical protein
MRTNGNDSSFQQQALQAAYEAEQAQQAQAAQQAGRASAQPHGHHGAHRCPQLSRYVFQHVPQGRAQPQRPQLPLRRAPQRPRPQAQRNNRQEQEPVDQPDNGFEQQELATQDKEGGGKGKRGYEADDGSPRRQPGFHQEHDDGLGGMAGDDKGAAASSADKPRPCRTPRRPSPSAEQVLAACGWPEAHALVPPRGAAPAPVDPQAQLGALAGLLLACARHGGRREPGKPTPTAVMLAALQAHLATQSRGAPDPATLDEVKALLVGLQPPEAPPGGLSPAAENAFVLLPLVLLNATRPRTPEQRLCAHDRLQMLRQSPVVGLEA